MLKYSHSYPHPISIVSDGVLKKTIITSSQKTFNKVFKLANHFINNPDPMVVPIYSFTYNNVSKNKNKSSYELEQDEIDLMFGDMDSSFRIEYSYDMKRLFVLSSEEKKIIKNGFLYLQTEREYTEPVLIKAKEEYPTLIEFLIEIMFQGKYWDQHFGNILKDECGDYKIIDIEGFHPLEQWNGE